MHALPTEIAEEARLTALAEHDLIGFPPEPILDHVVALAARLFAVPTAFVSLVGRDSQIFHAKVGLDLCETSREVAFCSHTIAGDDALVVLDATRDPHFRHNPLVTGPPYIRFYAGVPLRTSEGHAVGTLCLAGPDPRLTFMESERCVLGDLARLVLDRLELSRVETARRATQTRFEHIADTSPDAIVCADAQGRVSFWSAAAERLFGHTVAQALGQPLAILVPERMSGGHEGDLRQIARNDPGRLVDRTVELIARHRDGGEFPVELSLSRWEENGRAAFGAIVRDVRERRASEERLFRLVHLDQLTGLTNRTIALSRAGAAIEDAGTATILMLDLDGFKEVNDVLGHAAGDTVLRVAAQRLLTCVGPGETVSRLGGDEFALVLPGVGDPLRAIVTAEAVLHALAEPFHVEGQTLRLGASVGIAVAPAHGEEANELFACADMALYRAKAEGRRRYHLYTPALREATTRRRRCQDALHRAVERGEFVLFYQPQVRLSDGALVGAEALIRWQHPERGVLAPAAFLEVLEAGPEAALVGDWVLRTACAQAQAWRSLGTPGFRIGVNLFAAQFRRGDLAERVQATLAGTGLPATALELEITETIVLRHDAAVAAALEELRAIGVGIAFDDYGTGYASLSLLKRFPLTRLKIDRSFVTGMASSQQDATIIRAILQLGRGFGLAVIAEGIETVAEHERLRTKGCEEGQGYLFGKPMPPEAFARRFGLGGMLGTRVSSAVA